MPATHAVSALCVLALAGCAVPVGEGDDDIAGATAALDEAGLLTVVQCNPFYGGRYEPHAWSRRGFSRSRAPKTGATARAFAGMIARRYPDASLIGMQEMDGAGTSEAMRALLERHTGRPWRVRHYHKRSGAGAPPATHEAIFWRSDRLELIEDFGTREVDRVYRGRRMMQNRFAGALFRIRGTSREVAFFTGKLTWMGQVVSGKSGRRHRITEIDRAHEVAVLHRWIRRKTARHPNAARVVALDLNDDYRSRARRAFFRRHYRDGRSDRHTWWSPRNGRGHRFDYVFWSPGASAHVEPQVSPDFGSDHRAVIARVYLRPSPTSTATASGSSGCIDDLGRTLREGDTALLSCPGGVMRCTCSAGGAFTGCGRCVASGP